MSRSTRVPACGNGYNAAMAGQSEWVGKGRCAALLVLATVAAGARVYASGTEYVLPANGDNVIGFVTTAIARHEDTMLDIGRRYGVGYEEILAANPGMDPWLPGEGAEILIPTRLCFRTRRATPSS